MKQAQKKPLKGVIWRAITSYRRTLRPMMVATFPLIFIIGLLRWLTDDYTGDQYATLIILVAAFSTFVATRIAVVGWDWRKVRLIAFYNGLMGRYLSVLGLLAVSVVIAIPLIGGLFLAGLSLVAGGTRWWALPALALMAGGFVLFARCSLALYALADDMEISVLQAFQISNRLVKRFFWPYALRLLAIGFAVMLVAVVFGVLGSLVAIWLQDASTQLAIDLLGSWLITPFLLFIMARQYEALVENYE